MPAPNRWEFVVALVMGVVVTAITVALGGSGRAATTPGLVAAALMLIWLVWRRA
jgi:hypothetical protein